MVDPTGSTTYTRIAVEIGGVTVKSVTVTSPTTMNVTVSTVGTTPGAKVIRVVNPDGQVVQDAGQLLTVTGTAAPFFTSPNSLVCASAQRATSRSRPERDRRPRPSASPARCRPA